MSVKVAGIIKTAAFRNLFKGVIGKTKKLFGQGNALGNDVMIQGNPKKGAKLSGEVKLADKKLIRKSIQRKLLRIMLIQIMAHLSHLLLAGALFGPVVRDIQEEQGKNLYYQSGGRNLGGEIGIRVDLEQMS